WDFTDTWVMKGYPELQWIVQETDMYTEVNVTAQDISGVPVNDFCVAISYNPVICTSSGELPVKMALASEWDVEWNASGYYNNTDTIYFDTEKPHTFFAKAPVVVTAAAMSADPVWNQTTSSVNLSWSADTLDIIQSVLASNARYLEFDNGLYVDSSGATDTSGNGILNTTVFKTGNASFMTDGLPYYNLNTGWTGGSTFSVAMWVYVPETNDVQDTVFDLAGRAGSSLVNTNEDNQYSALIFQTNDLLRFTRRNVPGGTNRYVQVNLSTYHNKWVHVVGIMNQTHTRLFINGEKQLSGATYFDAINQEGTNRGAHAPRRIGLGAKMKVNAGSVYRFFDGNIDNFFLAEGVQWTDAQVVALASGCDIDCMIPGVTIYADGTPFVTDILSPSPEQITVNDLNTGEIAIVVEVNESFDGGQFTSSSDSTSINVSKLSDATTILPSGTTITNVDWDTTWGAATAGFDAITYTIKTDVNGTNTTLTTGTSDLFYNVTGWSTETTQGIMWVEASDSYFTSYARNLADFTIDYTASLTSLVCQALTVPNEDDLPAQARVPINFTVTAPLGFANENINEIELALAGDSYTSTTCTVTVDSGTQHSYNCTVPMRYFYDAGDYDLAANVTTTTGKEATGSSAAACEYAQLLASQRTVDIITFPAAAPGVTDAPGTPDLNVRNTGNVDFAMSLTAYNLIGRTTPVELLASLVKAGAAIGSAVTMVDSATTSVNMNISAADGAQDDIGFWLTMPIAQTIQEYYTDTPWQLVVSG
ncbi:LamG domain-containing protein, partial [Candidatus Woesearchaeota archaeon]|nr:LamG domain-containing protein [Candidatus Woesearchaeota archaeon]